MSDLEEVLADVPTMTDDALVWAFRSLQKTWAALGIDQTTETAITILEAYRTEIARRGLYLD